MRILLSVASLVAICARADVTPAQYLQSLTPLVFAQAHHLPHLTRFGWVLSSNANVELAKNWGYALTLSDYLTPTTAANASHTGTFDSGMVLLASNNPTVFKLSVILDRTFTNAPAGYFVTNSSGQFINYSGATTGVGTVPSPEGPDNYWQGITAYWVETLRQIATTAPPAIILNGGEYGLDVAGFGRTAWAQDPRVLAATNGFNWQRYSAVRKAHQIGYLTKSVYDLLPGRELYIFYNTTAESFRTFPNWLSEWGWDSDLMNTNTDLPSFESYYQGFAGHDFTNNTVNAGDMLTQYLNSVGFNYALGYKTNYSWISGGWSATDPTHNADINRYKGFIKCLYAGGMVGAVAGYFSYPDGGFDISFPSSNPPFWLQQMIMLSQVHAEFSYLETYLFNGSLLPGPSKHSMSSDQWSYEFTNTVADVTARVLARKLDASNNWLVCAWAADGANRNVTVNIPTLGTVTVYARNEGSVYKMTQTSREWVDGPPPTINATFGTLIIKQ